MLLSIILDIFIFQAFKTFYSTWSRLHRRLQNSCKAQDISLRRLLKSISEGKHEFVHFVVKGSQIKKKYFFYLRMSYS